MVFLQARVIDKITGPYSEPTMSCKACAAAHRPAPARLPDIVSQTTARCRLQPELQVISKVLTLVLAAVPLQMGRY